MHTDAYRLWLARIVTFVISAFVAASIVYWGFKLRGVSTSNFPLATQVEQMPLVGTQLIARALGGGVAPIQTAQVATPSINRYNLVGVVADSQRPGAALISVDGQEAKPVRVGNLVDNDMVLESVSGRQAVLSSGTGVPEKLTLEMPKPPQ